jgi:nitrogen fixation/metabolism regulation signal transduction histidine kinase
MAFSNFNLRIVVYVVLIILTSLAFTWSLYQPYMVVTSSGLAVLLLLETVALIRYNQKIKKDLLRFVDAIKNQDTSMAFPHRHQDHFMRELHQGFNEIITDFKLIRTEKELEHHFFRNIFQHIGIGVLAFTRDGKVKLINRALRNMFQSDDFSHIHHLGSRQKDLPDLLQSMDNGQESSFKLAVGNKMKIIALRVSDIKLEKEKVRIASFQDISREMNHQEVEAWQRLIRVLRHEIMNSISPIRIMSGNLLQRVSGANEKLLARDEQSREAVDDLKEGLQTIRKRSSGLSEFIETYRHLTRIPEPRFTEIRAEDILGDVARLFEKDLQEKQISLDRSVEPADLTILGDEKMLEQVLINLLKNAREAVEGKAEIKAKAKAKAKAERDEEEKAKAEAKAKKDEEEKAKAEAKAKRDEEEKDKIKAEAEAKKDEEEKAEIKAKDKAEAERDEEEKDKEKKAEAKAEAKAKKEKDKKKEKEKEKEEEKDKEKELEAGAFEGGIEMKACREGDHTVLTISDNGQGIPQDQIESIFIPFYTTRESGSGIGLSLSRQLIQLHNGTIEVHSRQNNGTRVTITLPY